MKKSRWQKVKLWFPRIIRSKVMWLAALGAGLTAIEASFGLFQPYVAGSVYAWISMGLAVGGAVLRTVTSMPLSDK